MRIFLLALIVFSLAVSVVSARTWYIQDDQTGDAPTIQAGIDSAAIADTVLLADGRFTGAGNRDIDFLGKEITVRSESGNPYACVIDCEGSSSSPHRGFYFGNNESSVSVLEGVSIEGCYSAYGSAVYCYEASPTIANCVFSGNSVSNTGGAIDLSNCSPVITDCTFSMNISETYGGAVACHNASPDFFYCAFISNVADFGGGAVWAYGGAPEFMGCTFIDNRSLWAGGIDCQEGCSAVLSDCSFFSNQATFTGGAMRTTNSSPTLMNCSLVADSSGYGGAGIHCGPGDSPILETTVIAFGQVGKGLSCDTPAGSPSLTCCIIYGNAGGDWVECLSGMDLINNNMHLDPKFCDLAGFSPNVEDCSPCLSANNSCGVDVGSGVSGCACGTPTAPTTWGRIKAEFVE
ncbi:MAG: hypothetical protein ABIJ00_05290 [Candidatus Eisenbacteria bacterium]